MRNVRNKLVKNIKMTPKKIALEFILGSFSMFSVLNAALDFFKTYNPILQGMSFIFGMIGIAITIFFALKKEKVFHWWNFKKRK